MNFRLYRPWVRSLDWVKWLNYRIKAISVRGALETISNRPIQNANDHNYQSYYHSNSWSHWEPTTWFPKTAPRTSTTRMPTTRTPTARTPTAPSIGGQRISKHRASSILTPTENCDYCDCQFQESEKISERDTYCTIPGYSQNRFQYRVNDWTAWNIQFTRQYLVKSWVSQKDKPQVSSESHNIERLHYSLLSPNRHKYFGEDLRLVFEFIVQGLLEVFLWLAGRITF